MFSPFHEHFNPEAVEETSLKSKYIVNADKDLTYSFWNYDEKVGVNDYATFRNVTASSELHEKSKGTMHELTPTIMKRVY